MIEQPQSLLDLIPGYRAAIEDENRTRSLALLGLTESICGIDVMPLTLRRFIILDVVRSPFVCAGGNRPTPIDVARFLWVVSPHYSPSSKWRRYLLMRKCRRFREFSQFSEAVLAISRYIAEAFQDSGSGSKGDEIPHYSFGAAMICSLGREFGWTPDTILDMPIKLLCQCIKECRKTHEPGAVLFNPSDKVRSQWLREVNNGRNPN